MARPEFIPVFEETESAIRDRMIERISDDWRKEPGDFIYDAVATAPEEIKQLQVNQDTILRSGHAQYAEGEDLDLLLAEVGLTRFQATPNKRTLSITADAGVNIPAGHMVTALITDSEGNPIEFTVDVAAVFEVATTRNIAITAVTAGTMANLATGTEFTLVPPIPGVRVITDLGTDIPGVEKESDEAAYERLQFKVNNPDTGGNKNDYKRWANEFPGVGDSRVIPRWNGNNTVKVVIVDTDKRPASAPVVNGLQEHLDPGQQGLGEGQAPCGARVTVVSATALPLDIEAVVTYVAGSDPTAVKADFEAQVDAYRKAQVFTEPTQPIVYNRIGAMLINTAGVSNYSDLLLNGGTVDILPGIEETPIVGQVNFL